MKRTTEYIFEQFADQLLRADDAPAVAETLASLGRQHKITGILICALSPLGGSQWSHDVLAESWPAVSGAKSSLLDSFCVEKIVEAPTHRIVSVANATTFKPARHSLGRLFTSITAVQATLLATIPMSDGRLGSVIFAGENIRREGIDLCILEAAALMAFRRIQTMCHFKKKKILTRRQQSVCNWLAAGKTSAQIAALLGIREDTVEHHIRRSRERLGARNRISTVVQAIRYGQLDSWGI